MGVGPKLRFRVLNRDAFRCQYCGRAAPHVKLEVDHRVPRAIGGNDRFDNLVTACELCNGGKSAMLLTKHLAHEEYRKVLTCKGGPLDGTVWDMVGKWPVLWVMRLASGEVRTYRDHWVQRDGWSEWDASLYNGHPIWEHDTDVEGAETLGWYRSRFGNEYDAGAMAWETVEEMLMFLAQFDWRGRS